MNIEIGQTKRYKNHTYIWSACEDCGKERWVAIYYGKAKHKLCISCANRASHIYHYINIPPYEGEIRHGKEIGKNRSHRYIWSGCPECSKFRWVELNQSKNTHLLCHKCSMKLNNSGEKNHYWRGGKRYHHSGYVMVKVQPEDFYYPMASKDGYIMEHRLAMAKCLNRCLLPWEIIHHRNGNKTDNSLQNLLLIKGNADHTSFTVLEKENKMLRRRILQLEKQLNQRATIHATN